MKIVRTKPPLHPDTVRGRNYVQDEMAECYIVKYDNRPLAEFEDDLVVLEWDIAVSKEDLELFCETVHGSDRVQVAPYNLYPESDPRLPSAGISAHRVVTHPTTWATRHVKSSDWECDLFGLGLAYLPRDVIAGYIADPNPADPRMTDANLSMWHYRQRLGPVPILWQVRPVHLHYTIPKEWPHGD